MDKYKKDLRKSSKEEIEAKREILNGMISEGVNNQDLLKVSQELDKLIGKYYKLYLDKK
ncbi:MAG: aspartyl-phosphate phosphatase Spo0E family protein [Tissierellia bacterium]|nr:aspartyl-phosphate phosphatase Spo0E family protein [Tissierellia bacterium]